MQLAGLVWGGVFKSYWYNYFRNYRQINCTLKNFGRKKNHLLTKDLISERIHHNVPFDEYFLFEFDKNNDEAYRRKFVSDIERVKIANSLNVPQNDIIFYDKEKTYEVFGEYYHRDILRINEVCNRSSFIQFVKKHNSFICKPIDGGCGKGIKILHLKSGDDVESVFTSLQKDYSGKCIIEELIIQNNLLSELHPTSVNTVRMPTIRFDDRVKIIHPFLRVGQGNSITDNAGSGGIICALDEITGEVIATSDEFGHSFIDHPNSGKRLIGFTVPHWEKAKMVVNELALMIPDNRYCSWDLALTQKGWVLVEANAKGQFVWQYATHKGFRNEIESILQEIKKDKPF